VPCLRRATALAYTDADEDAEKLLSFGGDSGDKGDEWVQTHAGRRTSLSPVRISKADNLAIATAEVNPQTIDDIPDDEALSKEANALNLGDRPSTEADIPDMDDIPDMEEEDLEGSSAAVVAKPVAPPM
jgi:ubiquitin-like-conjugating enzyme ATG3